MFKKLFAKKEERPTYKPNWQSYLTSMDGLPQSILIDLGLAAMAPVGDHPLRMMVRLPYRTPRADYLPDNDTAQALWAVEENLAEATRAISSYHVANVTYKGERQMHFYLTNRAAANAFTQAADGLIQSHELTFEIREDPQWVVYVQQLYPSPLQLQSIGNRNVMHQLQEQGDSFSRPREVYHWAYFRQKADLERYNAYVTSEGYSVRNQGQTEKGEWMLRFSREDNINPGNIDELVLPLWSQAEALGGDYDGWETSVEA